MLIKWNSKSKDGWHGKLRFKGTEHPFVEVRKTFDRDCCWSQMLIIVATNGYKTGIEMPENTQNTNVRISSNGAIAMTFEEMKELDKVVEEAHTYLKENKWL